MCIYCTTNNYRKIYENHNGIIPKYSDGRTYEIHHVDGNHSNNSPSNLTAVTIQEHYDIHYAQGDWYACKLIKLQRMDYTSEEISILTSEQNKKRIDEGTHHFLGGEIQSKSNQRRIKSGTHHLLRRLDGTSHATDRITAGTHHFLTRADGSSVTGDRVKNGTHPWLGGEQSRKNNLKMVEEGIHPFLGGKLNKKRIDEGTHHFLGKDSPNKTRCSCIFCKKETNLPGLTRNHKNGKCISKNYQSDS